MSSKAHELQRLYKGFEAAGDFVGGSAGRKSDRSADADDDFAEVSESAMLALHLPHAIEAYGNYRKVKIFRE